MPVKSEDASRCACVANVEHTVVPKMNSDRLANLSRLHKNIEEVSISSIEPEDTGGFSTGLSIARINISIQTKGKRREVLEAPRAAGFSRPFCP